MNTTKSNTRLDSHADGKSKGLSGRLKAGSDGSRNLLVQARRLANYGEISRRTKIAASCPVQSALAISRDAGFRIFAPDTFSEVVAINETALEVVSRLREEDLQTKKAQLKQNLLDMKSLTLESPHLRLALRTDILESVSSYLGVVPVLSDVDVWYSIPAGETPANSQLYHCDANDITQIKIFIYANDVSGNSGPLTVIGADNSKLIREKVGYTYEGKRKRVKDEKVHEIIGDKDQHPIIGPKGTCAFVDTSRCFHFGSRVQAGAPSRIVTVLQYFTPTSFVFAGNFRDKAPLRHLDDSKLTPLQKLVLGV